MPASLPVESGGDPDWIWIASRMPLWNHLLSQSTILMFWGCTLAKCLLVGGSISGEIKSTMYRTVASLNLTMNCSSSNKRNGSCRSLNNFCTRSIRICCPYCWISRISLRASNASMVDNTQSSLEKLLVHVHVS